MINCLFYQPLNQTANSTTSLPIIIFYKTNDNNFDTSKLWKPQSGHNNLWEPSYTDWNKTEKNNSCTISEINDDLQILELNDQDVENSENFT